MTQGGRTISKNMFDTRQWTTVDSQIKQYTGFLFFAKQTFKLQYMKGEL